jgi:RNA polymerase sigma-70 factor (ECF subfamily)
MDECEAIDRLKRDDIGGLEALVYAYQVRAVRAAYLVTHDLALAQDVVQAAFVKAAERIGQFDASRSFGPWFLKSVLRDAIKAAVRRDRHTSLESLVENNDTGPHRPNELVDPDAGPEALWEQAETADEVCRALRLLSPDQRAAIVSRYFLGLTERELALTMSLPHSTVKWRLHAARQRLRLFLDPMSIE